MADGTLTGQTIANTYKALLKITGVTAGGETLHATTQNVIEDGDGNPFPFSAAQDAVLFTGTSRLEFGDPETFIHQSADGVLTIESDTTLELKGTVTMSVDLAVAHGGTGVSTLTDGGVLLGSGSGDITAMAVLAAGEIVVGDGTTDPIALAAGATTTILVGGGAASPVWTAATGTGSPVRATSPTFVTPVLGVATGTSFQGIIGNVTPAAGTFTTIVTSGIISVDDTTDSSSTITGSIHTDGGLGVAKKSFFGDDMDLGGKYLVSEQGRQDHVANTMTQPYYRFKGSVDYIQLGQSVHLSPPKHISISMWINMEVLSSYRYFIASSSSSSAVDGYMMWWNSDVLSFSINHWDTNRAQIAMSAATYQNKWVHIVGTYDAVAGEVKVYLNTVKGTDDSYSTDIDYPGAYMPVIGALDVPVSYTPQGAIADVKIFNNTLTATEVKELYSGASVPFKYKGASQTDEVTGDDSDMDTVGNWAADGAATRTGGYDSGDAGHDKTLRIEAGDANWEGVKLATSNFVSGDITVGKSYRIKFDYKWISKTDDSQVYLGDTNDGIIGMTASAGSWAVYDQVITPTAKTNNTLRIYVNDDASGHADNEMLIDNVSLIPIGAVAEYDGSGIGKARWDDKSGNALHGTVTGATVENAPADADSGLTYEEGTWTPIVSDASGGGNEAGYSATREGIYTKIGNCVYYTFAVIVNSISGMTGANNVNIQGYPFTNRAVSGNMYQGPIAYTGNVTYATDNEAYVSYVAASSTYSYFRGLISGGTGTSLTVTQLTASGQLTVSGHYFV